jgi:hypothetical protein
MLSPEGRNAGYTAFTFVDLKFEVNLNLACFKGLV